MKYLILLLCVFVLHAVAASDSSKIDFLVINDIHLNARSQHTMKLTPSHLSGANDLDLKTFNRLIARVKLSLRNHTLPQPKFILLLGDLQGHRLFNHQLWKDEATVFRILKTNFPNIAILYTFGNNDSLLHNYGAFSQSQYPNLPKSPYQVAMQVGWQNGFLSKGGLCGQHAALPCILTEQTKLGCYVAKVASDLRLISINSILFSPMRYQTSDSLANLQLEWFEEQLQEARTHGASVLIAMHIPPGLNVYDNSEFWTQPALNQFLQLIHEYSDNIVGIWAGHTHQEELKVIEDGNGQPLAGVFLSPSLSTTHGNSPGIKNYQLRTLDKHWVVDDYTTYQFVSAGASIILKKLYNFVDYYCPNGADSLKSCLSHVTAEKMQKYYKVNNPKFPPKVFFPGDIIIKTDAPHKSAQ